MRDVCLLGGGHSHVLLIKRWAMNPLPGVRLTLVSSASQTPYSGMLPGLISGHYNLDEIHIDLRQLCTWANVRFIQATATALDLKSKEILFKKRPALSFDVLSLDTGSTPDLSIPGALNHVTPVKPVHDFYSRWMLVLQQLQEPVSRRLSIGVVGSGAGGFELLMALRYALTEHQARCVWFLRRDSALNGQSGTAGRLAIDAARRSGVEVVTDFDVSAVNENSLLARDGREFSLDEILWCTGAVGPDWTRAAGLAVDERGFVLTNVHLQSESHPFVFAAGDVGTQRLTPSEKAGVFAVRQAPTLAKNIRSFLLGEPLQSYRPQARFLSLMATGNKRAIASWGRFALEADWLWRWKDRIDQAFMRKFIGLTPINMNPALNRLPNALRQPQKSGIQQMQCRGCGGKVGSSILARVIASFATVERHDVANGLSPAGDAAVIKLDANSLLAQSVDHINAIVDDPYVLGKIAALHALSDVVTLAAEPQSAQVLISVTAASDLIKERDLTLLMHGVVDALNEEQCSLIGGHTFEGREMSVGLVVNAVVTPAAGRTKPDTVVALSPPDLTTGDVMILTQPVGIGTLFAAMMQQIVGIAELNIGVGDALEAMQTSNSMAAKVLRQHGAVAMTDVTGFGLLGHLQNLIQSSDRGAAIYCAQVPVFGGAEAAADQGVRSSLWSQNRQVLNSMNVANNINESFLSLLCDPQTGGGLLAVLPQNQCETALISLRQLGYPKAVVVGCIDDSSSVSVM